MLLMSAALATIGLQRTGWLDRVVQYHKEKLFKEMRELAPININAEIQPKPEGYEDSTHWDYDSVLRLLTLIRASETAKPVHKALRRMLQPTRRIMMSMKESMHRFPSLKKDDNAFYYDVDYSAEEGNLPAPPPVPEDQVVLVVSNPVEARLPSARISVKLLREILEARARAARQMASTTHTVIPWVDFIKTRKTTTEASTDAVPETPKEEETTTVADADVDTTPEADADVDTTSEAGADVDTTSEADADIDTTSEADADVDTTPEADADVDTTPEVDGGGTITNADDNVTTAEDGDSDTTTEMESNDTVTTTEAE